MECCVCFTNEKKILFDCVCQTKICIKCLIKYNSLICQKCNKIILKKRGYNDIYKSIFVNDKIKKFTKYKNFYMIYLNQIKSIIIKNKNDINFINNNKILYNYEQLSFEDKKNFISNCKKKNCIGFVIYDKPICDICKTIYCNKCYEINNKHNCLNNNIKTIIDLTKPCPNCLVRIYKHYGCDDMICTYCQIKFNWKNLEITTKTSNNHYKTKDFINKSTNLYKETFLNFLSDLDDFEKKTHDEKIFNIIMKYIINKDTKSRDKIYKIYNENNLIKNTKFRYNKNSSNNLKNVIMKMEILDILKKFKLKFYNIDIEISKYDRNLECIENLKNKNIIRMLSNMNIDFLIYLKTYFKLYNKIFILIVSKNIVENSELNTDLFNIYDKTNKIYSNKINIITNLNKINNIIKDNLNIYLIVTKSIKHYFLTKPDLSSICKNFIEIKKSYIYNSFVKNLEKIIEFNIPLYPDEIVEIFNILDNIKFKITNEDLLKIFSYSFIDKKFKSKYYNKLNLDYFIDYSK